MSVLKHLSDSDLHHAYILYSEPDKVRDSLYGFLHNIGVTTRANPDFHHLATDVVNIASIRGIIDSAGMSSMNGGKKVYVIECRIITLEAQNAMLKLFEEPAAHTHFFVITPTKGSMLPTLSSRVISIDIDQGLPVDNTAKDFLSATYKKRMDIIGGIIKDKDRTAGQKLVADLMTYVHSLDSEHKADVLKKLLFVHLYITTPSSSLKMLLEYIALTLPRIK